MRLLGAEESSADSGKDTRPHLRSTGLTEKLFVELYQIKIGCNSGSSKNLHYIFYLKKYGVETDVIHNFKRGTYGA